MKNEKKHGNAHSFDHLKPTSPLSDEEKQALLAVLEGKPWYQTQHSTHEVPGEKTHKKSATIPGRHLSPQQVMERFASGRTVTAPPSYYEGDDSWAGDEALPDFDAMDLSDLEDFRQATSDRVQHLKTKLELERQESKKKYLESQRKLAERNAQIEAFIQSKKDLSGGVKGGSDAP